MRPPSCRLHAPLRTCTVLAAPRIHEAAALQAQRGHRAAQLQQPPARVCPRAPQVHHPLAAPRLHAPCNQLSSRRQQRELHGRQPPSGGALRQRRRRRDCALRSSGWRQVGGCACRSRHVRHASCCNVQIITGHCCARTVRWSGGCISQACQSHRRAALDKAAGSTGKGAGRRSSGSSRSSRSRSV